MNRIYWDEDKICFFTDKMNTEIHSHWMIQLFLCLDGELELRVNQEHVNGRCIVVNKNISHVFCCKEQWHLSFLIEPASSLNQTLSQAVHGKTYCVFDDILVKKAQESAQRMIANPAISCYQSVVKQIYQCIGMNANQVHYDERIEEVLYLLKECSCDEHSLEEYAKKVNLSQSRLVHLFRQQVGIPLKNYVLLHQMKEAFLELADGRSITQAALDAGFNTPSHFAATAKKMMGISASLSLKDSQFLKVMKKKL